MELHTFNPTTGEFLGSRLARLDPLETNVQEKPVYLIPKNSTPTAPPNTGDDEVSVWNGKEWEVRKDFRGSIWYDTDGNEVVVSVIGDPAAQQGLSKDKPPPSSSLINSERDRRIAAGFSFGGKMFDFDPASKGRITGAATLAGFAIGNGATPGDLRWANPDQDFGFITQDNTVLTMDAFECFAMGQTAARHETAHIFAARALKEAPVIPTDYTDDRYWPSL